MSRLYFVENDQRIYIQRISCHAIGVPVSLSQVISCGRADMLIRTNQQNATKFNDHEIISYAPWLARVLGTTLHVETTSQSTPDSRA
ncbi:MAG: hypothetical protein EOM24_27820 [Chloroflexia bacterium]|nr:hypothetical protein [Chloroflexia bacterium]